MYDLNVAFGEVGKVRQPLVNPRTQCSLVASVL